MFTYTYAHDSGFTTLAYINAADAVTDVSYTDFGIEYTGIDGLRLVMQQGDVEANYWY